MIVEEQEEHPDQVLQAEDAQSAQQQSGSGWTSEKPTSGDYVTVSDYSKSAGGFHHTGLAVDSDNTQGFSTKDPTNSLVAATLRCPARGNGKRPKNAYQP